MGRLIDLFKKKKEIVIRNPRISCVDLHSLPLLKIQTHFNEKNIPIHNISVTGLAVSSDFLPRFLYPGDGVASIDGFIAIQDKKYPVTLKLVRRDSKTSGFKFHEPSAELTQVINDIISNLLESAA